MYITFLNLEFISAGQVINPLQGKKAFNISIAATVTWNLDVENINIKSSR